MPNLAHAFVKLVITDRAPVVLVVRTFTQFVQQFCVELFFVGAFVRLNCARRAHWRILLHWLLLLLLLPKVRLIVYRILNLILWPCAMWRWNVDRGDDGRRNFIFRNVESLVRVLYELIGGWKGKLIIVEAEMIFRNESFEILLHLNLGDVAG